MQCNFCTYQSIKRDAKKNGSRVVKRYAVAYQLGGVNIYVVPKGVEVPKVIKGCDVTYKGDAFHRKYFRAWFMELPDHCAC
jgi:hypothetical protein